MIEQLPLSGLHVLVVEDQYLIAMDLAERLARAGCSVIGPAPTVRQALQEIAGAPLDGALLDIHLSGEQSFPVAELLTARGVPFFFLSGYDSTAIVPDEFAHAPRLTKPVDFDALIKAVAGFRRGHAP